MISLMERKNRRLTPSAGYQRLQTRRSLTGNRYLKQMNVSISADHRGTPQQRDYIMRQTAYLHERHLTLVLRKCIVDNNSLNHKRMEGYMERESMDHSSHNSREAHSEHAHHAGMKTGEHEPHAKHAGHEDMRAEEHTGHTAHEKATAHREHEAHAGMRAAGGAG
jgi:hypothetical protein